MYLHLLNDDLERKGSKPGSTLSALTLMSSHTHEINNVTDQPLYSNHMRRHHSRYGSYFNRKYDRCGKVAQDRPKTCLIGDDYHEMIATFYAHANPVRAHIVRDAKNYKWSTHNLYAFGKKEPWMRNIVLPRWYLALGRTPRLRQQKYRSLFDKYLREGGRRKSNFHKKPFFGPPRWTQIRQNMLRLWREEQRPP